MRSGRRHRLVFAVGLLSAVLALVWALVAGELDFPAAPISMKLLLRIANTLGCALEVLLDTKAAVAWGENRDEPEMEAVEEEEEASYSLEEVRLLLQILQPRKSASGLKR